MRVEDLWGEAIQGPMRTLSAFLRDFRGFQRVSVGFWVFRETEKVIFRGFVGVSGGSGGSMGVSNEF